MVFNNKNIANIIDIAVNAGLLAILERENGLSESTKIDGSLVTSADTEVSEFIKANLTAVFGSKICIVSEEDDCESSGLGEYFCVDPIDGTSHFAKNGNFCINIAYVKNKKPVFGLVHCPMKHKTYYAITGKEVYKMHNGDDLVLQSTLAAKKELQFICNNRAIIAGNEGFEKNRVAIEKIHSNGYKIKHLESNYLAAEKYCLALEKNNCIIYSPYAIKEWDIAAPYVMLQNHGYIVTDLNGNNIEFGLGGAANYNGIIVSKNPDLIKLLQI